MENLLTALIRDAEVDVGSSAVMRGCQRGRYDVVLLADDAAEDVLRDILAVARVAATRVIRVPTREELGVLVNHRRPTAAVGLKIATGDLLNAYSGPPVDWSLDVLVWFHTSRFTHLEGGYKNATLRRGLRRPWALTLGVVDAQSSRIRGRIAISEVRWINWGAVEHSADILRNEYPSEYSLLRNEMLEIYPNLESSTWMTYYRFIYEPIAL